jgi:hypothetical protein
MNKVVIERNSDGTYNITLPGGGQSTGVAIQDAIKRLKYAEQEFQAAIDDIKANRNQLEKNTASP